MKFKEVGHEYTSDNKKYRSVTGIIEEFVPKKNWTKIAQDYADKHGLTLEVVQAKWKYEKDISLIRGSKYHAQQEAKDLSLPFAVLMSSDEIETITVHPATYIDGEKIGQNQKLEDGVYPELLMWIDSLELAGQADRVEINKGLINIIDYKSSKKIEIEGWKPKFGTSRKLLSPCNHLDDTNYWKYALQLNFYAYIVQRHNPQLKIGKLILRHVMFEEYPSEKVTGIKDYTIPHLQKEIKAIVQLIKNKKI